MTHIIGLTGSIAMGKSAVSAIFRKQHIQVHDADAAVHRLMGPNGKALPALAEVFSPYIDQNGVDRQRLGPVIFSCAEKRRQLETILHPLVRQDRINFLKQVRRRRQKFCVLDIPLLYEKSLACQCDSVMVVTAPAYIQTQRALRRRGMTIEKLNQIRATQMPDWEKRKRADFVIFSSLDYRFTRQQVLAALRRLCQNPKNHASGRQIYA